MMSCLVQEIFSFFLPELFFFHNNMKYCLFSSQVIQVIQAIQASS